MKENRQACEILYGDDMDVCALAKILGIYTIIVGIILIVLYLVW